MSSDFKYCAYAVVFSKSGSIWLFSIMDKLNCWEYKKCGRQIGGENTNELGVCPASTQKSADGVNNGRFGGRCCWVIAGNLYCETVHGTFAAKEDNCLNCDFSNLVRQEEGEETQAISRLIR
jgi:hypothetical protein